MNATAEALPEEVPYKVGPGKPPLEAKFTSELARLAGIRSGQSRRGELNQAGNSPVQTGQNRVTLSPLEREANELWKELKLLRTQVREAKTSKEKSDLSNAYTRLFEAWQILTGTERPGTRRTSKAKRDPASGGDPFSGSSTPAIVSPRLFEQRNIPL